MTRINIYEAKTNLSRVLEKVERGEIFIVCRRNEPIAEIRPIPRAETSPRPIGLHKGQFEVPSEFHQPLPTELERAFQGMDG